MRWTRSLPGVWFARAAARHVATGDDVSTQASVPKRGERGGSESGETLVEVLLALIILAMASVAMITAFATDISASAEHRSLANFDTALASSLAMTTTLIQQQYVAVFAACPDPANPLGAYPSPDTMKQALNITGYSAAIASSGSQPAVEYTDGNTFTPTCSPNDVGQPQLINVVVTDPAGYSQSDTVAVIDPTNVPINGGQGNIQGITLEFTTPPVGGPLGSPLATQPAIEVLDNGQPLVGAEPSLSLTLTPGSNPNGAALVNCATNGSAGGTVTYHDCTVNEIGSSYTLTATYGEGNSAVTTTSSPFQIYPASLTTPTITALTPSTVTAGALNVTFNTSTAASVSYTAEACTNVAMTANCISPVTIGSGSDLTGLVAGASYYVQVTATSPTSSYLSATSAPVGPTMATVQLAAPSALALAQGSVPGSLLVTFTPPTKVANGQTYTVTACTNSGMNQNCVTNSNFTSGSNLTGLSYIPGGQGTSYYVQVSSNASTGYLASSPSTPPVQSPKTLSAVQTPTGLSTAPSASQVGAITVAFTEPAGTVAPSSYTATVCPSAAVTSACVVVPTSPPGSQLTGLTPGSSYYVQVTAVSSTTGYASATTAFSSPAVATIQLAAPTGVAATFGTVGGSLWVTFSPPNTVATPQTYTVEACTNAAMSSGCVTNTNYVSGSNMTGLKNNVGGPDTTYFVQVVANGSSGYLASSASTQVSQADASSIGIPGTPSAATSKTTTGAIVITFANSSGVAPTSYTAMACMNQSMTSNCVVANSYVSGTQFTGLNSGSNYWVEVTAIAPSGYVNTTSATSQNPTRAK